MYYDIAIVGAGPGGYAAALRAAQLGAKVALIEKAFSGGTCLNTGCIPTKAMLASVDCLENVKHADSYGVKVADVSLDIQAVYQRKDQVVSKVRKGLEQLLSSYNNLALYYGEATIISANKLTVSGKDEAEIEFKHLIIATGSSCGELPGFEVDHHQIINNDDALRLSTLPKDMIIVGAGAIGLEWGRIFAAFGVNVTIIEMLNRILPTCDEDISSLALKAFKRNKITIKTALRVDDIQKSSSGITLALSDGFSMTAEMVFLAVGRRPNTDLKGLEALGVEFNGRFIKTNQFMQTNVPNVYAIGDVVGKLQLAHVASHEAIVAVEHILDNNSEPMDYSCVPFCIYGHPEIAAVGLTEEQVKTLNLSYDTNIQYYAANGKAIAEAETFGMVKTIMDSHTKKILGVHILGEHASDIIHLAVLAVKHGLTSKDFRETIFAHPTFSELFYESVRPLHVPKLHKASSEKR